MTHLTRLNRLHVCALLLVGGLIWAAVSLGATDLFPA